jgi:uncharacterized protein involved in exopolysaccharide biosynthesis
LVTFDDDDENIKVTSSRNSTNTTTSLSSAEDAEMSYYINNNQIRIFKLDEIIQEVIAKVRLDVLTIMNFITPPILLRSSVRRTLSKMKAIIDRTTPKVIAIVKDNILKNIIEHAKPRIQALKKQIMQSPVGIVIQDTCINMRDMLRRYVHHLRF